VSPRLLDLNETIRSFSKILRRLVEESVELDFRLAATPQPVRADPGQIEQVLLNLVANARDAMPDGGRVTIATSPVTSNGTRPPRSTLPPGSYVELSVSDTGTGMPETVQARLFEPFFTTKPVGSGTGLGLATVHGIVKQSGGHIGVQSTPGHGTTFTVHLPAASRTAEDGAALADGARVLDGSETILVVEDNTALRRLHRAGRRQRHAGEADCRRPLRRHRGGADRRRHAGPQRPGAGPVDPRPPSCHQGRLHVWVHRAPPRNGARVPPEAVHVETAPRHGASGSDLARAFQRDARSKLLERFPHDACDLRDGGLGRLAFGVDAADGRGGGVREVAAPARRASLVPAVGDVGRERVQPGAGTLADQMHHDVRAGAAADVVPGTHSPVPHDHVTLAETVSASRQRLPHGGQEHP
jgi:hypothetical protein